MYNMLLCDLSSFLTIVSRVTAVVSDKQVEVLPSALCSSEMEDVL